MSRPCTISFDVAFFNTTMLSRYSICVALTKYLTLPKFDQLMSTDSADN